MDMRDECETDPEHKCEHETAWNFKNNCWKTNYKKSIYNVINIVIYNLFVSTVFSLIYSFKSALLVANQQLQN